MVAYNKYYNTEIVCTVCKAIAVINMDNLDMVIPKNILEMPCEVCEAEYSFVKYNE